MNEQLKKLANIWANRRAEDEKLGITYTFSEKALQVFADKVREEHTQSVINWINDNVGLIDEEARADLLKHFGVEE